MTDVVIVDARKKWMIQEDKRYICETFCKNYRRCSTKAGSDCKVFGGNIIPKIRY